MNTYYNFLIVDCYGRTYNPKKYFFVCRYFSHLHFYHSEAWTQKIVRQINVNFGNYNVQVLPVSDQLKVDLFAAKNITAQIQIAIISEKLFSKFMLTRLAKLGECGALYLEIQKDLKLAADL